MRILLFLFYLPTFFACKEKIATPRDSSSIFADEYKKERMLSVQEGTIIPDAMLLGRDSSSVSLYKYFDKPTWVNFWASWCSPCVDNTPIFTSLSEMHGDKFNFVAISVDDEYGYWRDYLNEFDWSGDHFWFGNKENEDLYAVLLEEHTIENKKAILLSLPQYLLIDTSGVILSRHFSTVRSKKRDRTLAVNLLF